MDMTEKHTFKELEEEFYAELHRIEDELHITTITVSPSRKLTITMTKEVTHEN